MSFSFYRYFGESASAIIDAANTEVLSDDLVYLGAWYDNECLFLPAGGNGGENTRRR